MTELEVATEFSEGFLKQYTEVLFAGVYKNSEPLYWASESDPVLVQCAHVAAKIEGAETIVIGQVRLAITRENEFTVIAAIQPNGAASKCARRSFRRALYKLWKVSVGESVKARNLGPRASPTASSPVAFSTVTPELSPDSSSPSW